MINPRIRGSNRIRIRNRLFLTIVVFFLTSGYYFHVSASLGDGSLLDDDYSLQKSPDLINAQGESGMFYEKNNLSQFDVSERVGYNSNKDILDIKNEYLSFDIPEYWTGKSTDGEVSSLFSEELVLEHENMNFSLPNTEWVSNTSHPFPPSVDSQPYANFSWSTYNENDGYMEIKFNNTEQYTPADFHGEIINDNTTYAHDGIPVEIGEKVQGEESELALDNEFDSDPGYNVLYDPYGVDRQNSDVDAYHDPGIDSLITELDLWDGMFDRGDPSVAFQTLFYIPFEADSVTINFGWAVENIGYEHKDGFRVKSRVNGQFINGEVSAYGEVFDDAGAESLENDLGADSIASHDVWDRTYNITNLVGTYGNRVGWHSLDFGCLMEKPNFEKGYTPDEVVVKWDYIRINATHRDWYKAAEINLQYSLENIGGSSLISDEMALVMRFGDPGTYAERDMGRWVINRTQDLNFGGWETNRVNLSVRIPHTYANYFSKDAFSFSVGLECVNPYTKYTYDLGLSDDSSPWAYILSIDNLQIQIKYILGSPEDAGLQYRVKGSGDPWTDYSSTGGIITQVSESFPGFQIEFQTSNGPGASSTHLYMRYSARVYIEKYSDRAAEASVKIISHSDSSCVWNITYNTTFSVEQFDDSSLLNNTFYQYNLTIADLPAFDGLGADSADWNIYSAMAPNTQNLTEQLSKYSSDPYRQNITIINSTYDVSGSLGRGVWCIYASQMNYMVDGSLNHINGNPSERFYQGDNSNYTLKTRNLGGGAGNYSVFIYNASDDIIDGFPRHHQDQINYTGLWIVNDYGVGNYQMVSFFNNTDIFNQTTRLGWWRDTFQTWRHTQIQVLSNGTPVFYGQAAEYIIEFNSTEFGGISNAVVQGYNNASALLWGKDWTGQYLLDYKIYLGNGRYKIGLKTEGVPYDNYSIHFVGSKPYHDATFSNIVYLNITTIEPLKNLTLTYLYGAFNISEKMSYLCSNNIPIVNDTSNFIIQFQLNESGGSKVEDAYITARFNATNNAMVGIEQYIFTHLNQDKGVYNLTLNCKGLNATDPVHYNYTLSISISAGGFNPLYENISVGVRPMPLEIQADAIPDIYEGESFIIRSSLYINPREGLIGCQFGFLEYNLYNSSNYLVDSGSMPRTSGITYEKLMVINETKYLNPGDFYILIHASGENLQDTASSPIEFTVYEKYSSKISLIFPEQVRISKFFTIAAKLSYVDLSPIANEQVHLKINYSTDYSYQTMVRSDEDGRAVYELSIPDKYKGNNLTVVAEFTGTNLIKSCIDNMSQKILGKIPVNITFSLAPETAHVGYSATYGIDLAIEGEENYQGTLVYLFGFYNFQNNSSSKPSIIHELAADENGSISYTIDPIADGFKNLTVFFEYLGNSETEHQINSTFTKIIGKWNTSITCIADGIINSMPAIVRRGQTINVNISLITVEASCTESLAGMPLAIAFNYSTTDGENLYTTYTYFLDEDGCLFLSYTILDQDHDLLNMTITFTSTSRMNGATLKLSTPLNPKKNVVLNIQTSSKGRVLQGVYIYSLQLHDEDLIPLSDCDIIFTVFDSSGYPLTKHYEGVTNDQGFVSVSIDMSDLTPGKYTLRAEFAGEGVYSSGSSDEIDIEVTTSWLIFLEYLPYIMLGVITVAIATFMVYRMIIVPRKTRRMQHLLDIHQRFEDAENIQYILIVSRDSGLSIYSRSFTDLPVDADLISGFLTAISSFGEEIKGKMKDDGRFEEGLEELSYKQFKIVVNDGEKVRTAVLLLNEASHSLKRKLKEFNLKFEEYFTPELQTWQGEPLRHTPIIELIEYHLEVDLLYKHNLNPSRLELFKEELRKDSMEIQVLNEAMEPKFDESFKIRAMLDHMSALGEDEVIVFNAIDRMRQARVLYPVNAQTQHIIDKFKPIINRLSIDSKRLLTAIGNGLTTETSLRKLKGIKNFHDSVTILIGMDLIDKHYNLTGTGSIIVDLMKLVPHLAESILRHSEYRSN